MTATTPHAGLPYPEDSDHVIDGAAAIAALAAALDGGGWHLVGGAGEPAFLNGWSNVGGNDVPCRYRKDGLGFVHVEAAVNPAGGGGGTVVFTLPAGFRPSHNLTVATEQGGPSYAYVGLNGTVQPGTATGTALHLSFSFYAGLS